MRDVPGCARRRTTDTSPKTDTRRSEYEGFAAYAIAIPAVRMCACDLCVTVLACFATPKSQSLKRKCLTSGQRVFMENDVEGENYTVYFGTHIAISILHTNT